MLATSLGIDLIGLHLSPFLNRPTFGPLKFVVSFDDSSIFFLVDSQGALVVLSFLRLLPSFWISSSTTSLMFYLYYTWSILQHSFFWNFIIFLNVLFYYFFSFRSYDQLRLSDNTLWILWCRLLCLLVLPLLCSIIGHLRFSSDIWTLELDTNLMSRFFKLVVFGHLVALLPLFRLWVSVTQVFLVTFYHTWLETMLLFMQLCFSWSFMSTWLALVHIVLVI